MDKKGVDLSSWQADMDAGRVLGEAGMDFAILKLSEGRSLKDGCFTDFYDKCRGAKIPVGAYVYSHAADATGGRAEAEFALSLLAGRELSLPLYLDIEGELLSRDGAALTDSALAFGDAVTRAGYKARVYASLSTYKNILNTQALRDKGLSIWCAAYNDVGPGMDCDIWQHSCSGRLIGYGFDVDLNLMLRDILGESGKEELRLWRADMSVLCRGFYGTQVEALQKLLGITPTGVFDRETENAVKSFQALCGIAEDGIAGPQTYNMLKENLK